MTRLKSIIHGRDSEVLSQMLDFYDRPAGRIIDVTCNRRKMWSGLDTANVTFCDIDPEVGPDVVCDFRRTPFPDGHASLIIFDPPHLPSAAGTEASHAQYKADYGLERSVAGDNISSIFPEFLAEAKRLLVDDGIVIAKLADYVHNHKYQWVLSDYVAAVKAAGLTPCDLIIKADPCGGNLKSGKWKKSYHARRSHSWFVVARKGKCEPRKGYRENSQVPESVPDRPPADRAGWLGRLSEGAGPAVADAD